MEHFRVATVLILFVLWAVDNGLAAVPLDTYHVNLTAISTSGFSSGGAMATQLHVAYSGLFMGVGMAAGNPYYCAEGRETQANSRCMTMPEFINVADLTTKTTFYESNNEIDSTSNMYNHRVFIFHGELDSVVVPGVGLKVKDYYSTFVNAANIKTNFTVSAQQTFPTVDRGRLCDVYQSPYMGRCNYNGAYEILNHIYGGLVEPSGVSALPGKFYEYNQTEFFSGFDQSLLSMDAYGYVYAPSACDAGATCKLHVILHGCRQGRELIGDEFARYAGYNEVGELNNIIMLYPQAVTSDNNQQGCWDWWGYTGPEIYATKSAPQLLVIWRMVDKITYD